MSHSSLPETHRALVVLSPTVDPQIETRAVPQASSGSPVLRIVSAPILSYCRNIFLGNSRGYTYPIPLVPGFSAIARIAAPAIDAGYLGAPGQLVFFDSFVRSRDQDGRGQRARWLSAVHDGYTPASKRMMKDGGWRDGTHAEYMLAPLENCYPLDEAKLLGDVGRGGLGYTTAELSGISTAVVPYGGLRSVDLRVGERVLVSPATGVFGGAACSVALAMGARVVAWGRDTTKLEWLKATLEQVGQGRYKGMVEVVAMTSDADADAQNLKRAAGDRGFDVFFDISPFAAQGSHHLKTGILALRQSGRVSLMGGFREDVPIPHVYVMHFDITLKGKWMYEKENVVEIIRLVEDGVLLLGERGGWDVVGRFKLEQWREAWDLAAERTGRGEQVVIEP